MIDLTYLKFHIWQFVYFLFFFFFHNTTPHIIKGDIFVTRN